VLRARPFPPLKKIEKIGADTFDKLRDTFDQPEDFGAWSRVSVWAHWGVEEDTIDTFFLEFL
jgi:hypothetical protein